jgi:hypothetical protein
MYLWVNDQVSRIDSGSTGAGILALNGSGTGNVGIGTTTPGDLLEIVGATQAALRITSGNAPYLRLYSSGTASADVRNWTISANEIQYGDFDIRQSTTRGGNPQSTGASRFHIDFNGNVGIGTTTPGAKLEVLGGALRIYDNSIPGGTIEFKRTSDNWTPGIIAMTHTGSYGGDLAFNLHPNDSTVATAPATVMMLKSSGNVGIGTTAPGAKLQVGGGLTSETSNSIFVTAYSTDNSAYYSGRIMYELTDGGGLSAERKLHLGAFADATNVTILGSGNVGIGTTAPGYKLDVAANVDDYAACIYNAHSTGEGLYIKASSTSYALYAATYDGTEAAWISGSGYGYFVKNCSALSFTDRPGSYIGDALSDIESIQTKAIGHIDHKTLPTKLKREGDERLIGDTLDMLILAVKEITLDLKSPGYEGNALLDLKTIRGTKKAGINHRTLPIVAQRRIPRTTGITEDKRDIGMMVSILTKAFQEQMDINDALTARIAVLEAA